MTGAGPEAQRMIRDEPAQELRRSGKAAGPMRFRLYCSIRQFGRSSNLQPK